MKTSIIVTRADGTEYPTVGESVYTQVEGLEQAAWILEDGSLVPDEEVRYEDPLDDPETWTTPMWEHFQAIGGFSLPPEEAHAEMAKAFGPEDAKDTDAKEGD